MNRFRIVILSFLALFAIGAVNEPAALADGFRVTVRASAGPAYLDDNAGFVSLVDYMERATSSLLTDGSENGSRLTDPAAYTIAGPTVLPTDIIGASDFYMYGNDLSPDAPFDDENGTSVYFGAVIEGGRFRPADVTLTIHGSNTGDAFAMSNSFAQGFHVVGECVAVDFGTDGVEGGGDDIVTPTTLLDTNFYNKIAYVGPFWVGFDASQWPGFTKFQQFNDVMDYINMEAPFSIWCQYILRTPDGARVLAMGRDTVVVPVPGTAALIGLSSLAFARRRRARAA